MRVRRAVSEIAGLERICDDIDASIEQALRELRAIAYLLYPQELLADGLKATIEQFVNGFSARTSLKVNLEITEEADVLAYEAKRSLLSIIQEALSNVFRHAKATQVKITMHATETRFLLQISDDGRGITTGGERISLGVGIPSMRARLRRMGGTLEFCSSSTTECAGTTLCATIPRSYRDEGVSLVNAFDGGYWPLSHENRGLLHRRGL
jgi:two-component system sensor histidine kinase UhpB